MFSGFGMKAVILAGGLGTRLAEETSTKPKPMVEIGGRPILWHVMKIFSHYGVNDFIICCGYKGYAIKEYFSNYALHLSDVTFDLKANEVFVHNQRAEEWRITLVDTGDDTMTGGRLKRVSDYLYGDDSFCFTYGDGVADVNIADLITFHKAHGREATVTSVVPPGRFGAIEADGAGQVTAFVEKPRGDGARINGGFFILSPKVLDRIGGDNITWEEEPMMGLVADGQLMTYEHNGFWQPMDTLRDRNFLERSWENGTAPWKVWS